MNYNLRDSLNNRNLDVEIIRTHKTHQWAEETGNNKKTGVMLNFS